MISHSVPPALATQLCVTLIGLGVLIFAASAVMQSIRHCPIDGAFKRVDAWQAALD